MDAAESFPDGAVEVTDLAGVFDGPRPFTTVLLATGGIAPDAAAQSEIRWKDLRRSLEARGASSIVLEEIHRLVPGAHLEGATMFAAADGDGVRLVDHGDTPATPDLGLVGPLPHLLPVVRWRQAEPPFLVVLIDRTGADLVGFRGGGPELEEKVRGETAVIHKVHAGGWSQRRYQQRAENTWEENAGSVSAAVETLARRLEARRIVVAGDVRAIALLRDDLPKDLDALVRVVPGERARDRAPSLAIPGEVGDLIADLVREEGDRFLARAREERGQGDLYVDGVDATARALGAAQVAVLMVADDSPSPEDGHTVWIGPDPAQLAGSREDVVAMGVDAPAEVPALDALVRAAVATDATIRTIEGDHGSRDGVAGLLRWKT